MRIIVVSFVYQPFQIVFTILTTHFRGFAVKQNKFEDFNCFFLRFIWHQHCIEKPTIKYSIFFFCPHQFSDIIKLAFHAKRWFLRQSSWLNAFQSATSLLDTPKMHWENTSREKLTWAFDLYFFLSVCQSVFLGLNCQLVGFSINLLPIEFQF